MILNKPAIIGLEDAFGPSVLQVTVVNLNFKIFLKASFFFFF